MKSELRFFFQIQGLLKQIIQTVKGQDNGNRIYFLTFSVFSCGKMEKIIFPTRKNIFPSRTIFFPIFPGATLQKNNEISIKNNLLGLRKDRI